MAKPGITPDSRMGRKPRTKKISMRSAVHNIAGQEPPYPVHQFSNRVFVERPRHNPFATDGRFGYLLVYDDFERALITDSPGEAWRSLSNTDYYEYPLLDNGVAVTSADSYTFGAALREDIGSPDAFIEGELQFTQTGDFYSAPWLWLRASIEPPWDNGYYAIVGSGDYDFYLGEGPDPRIELNIFRWDSTPTDPKYTRLSAAFIYGTTDIPLGSLFRFVAEGRILTATLDLGGTGEIDLTTQVELPIDDPYKAQHGVGIGLESYYPADGGFRDVRIGLP